MVAGGGLQVNWNRIEQLLLSGAMRGGQKGAEVALERVRRHAPVRKLFRGTTYRAGRSGFRQPIERRVTFRDVSGEVSEFRGHANSSEPLFRTRNRAGRTTFLTGDFRQIDRVGIRRDSAGVHREVGTQLGRVRADVLERTEGGRGIEFTRRVLRDHAKTQSSPKILSAVSAEDVNVAGGKALTSRGRYEIRSGRANFRSPGGTVRVGGRLKGELHLEGPIRTPGVIWWYVVSSTKDPETGRLYPRDQEFGTVHHKAHPFMRPGLHESRDAFRRSVRRSMPGRLVK